MAEYWACLVLLVATVSIMVVAEAAMSCDTVATDLSPCIGYVLIGGIEPSSECCDGARSLLDQAQATSDRQAVCSCLKSATRSALATPAVISNAVGLPAKCGISLPFQISTSTDCSKIQ